MFKCYSKIMGYTMLTVVLIAALTGVLNVAGVFGERVVYENSFQYKEGMKQRSNTLRSQIAEIDMQIVKNPHLKEQLLAQRKVLEIQLEGVEQ